MEELRVNVEYNLKKIINCDNVHLFLYEEGTGDLIGK